MMTIKDTATTDGRVRTALALALWHLEEDTEIPASAKDRDVAFKASLPVISPKVGRLMRLLDSQNVKMVAK